MTSLLHQVLALARKADRVSASFELGRALGGDRLLLFVRDHEIGVLLPAPGLPQTFPTAREWRHFLDASVASGDCVATSLTPPEGGDPQPAYAFAQGADVVAVVVGTSQRPPEIDALRPLLSLLESVIQCERVADHAVAREQVARQSVAHAEALAKAFDQSRVELQRALTYAEASRHDLEIANETLGDQASEMEAQAEELTTQADELSTQAEQLQATNAALDSARVVAEMANRAKSQFLATMSHELRTPLNAIAGHLQLIELGIYGPITAEQRTALERIDRSQRHLLGLINDVLNLARIEAGRVEYALADLRLSDVLSDLGGMVEPQYKAKNLRYAVSTSDPHLAVRGDREKLEQILLNLLSNATKFTPPYGSIEITCAIRPDAPGLVFIRVTDTGMGIPDDKLLAIFEPFVQVNSGHSRPSEGTGLGLAISRDLARGMGGDLRVRSVYGKGSTFTLSLPAAG